MFQLMSPCFRCQDPLTLDLVIQLVDVHTTLASKYWQPLCRCDADFYLPVYLQLNNYRSAFISVALGLHTSTFSSLFQRHSMYRFYPKCNWVFLPIWTELGSTGIHINTGWIITRCIRGILAKECEWWWHGRLVHLHQKVHDFRPGNV